MSAYNSKQLFGSVRLGPFGQVSYVLLALVAIMLIVQLFNMADTRVFREFNGAFVYTYQVFDVLWGLVDSQISGRYGQALDAPFLWPQRGWITHIFVHSSWWHLAFNAIALVSFGAQIERLLGSVNFLILFFAAAIAAAIAQLGWNMIIGQPLVMVGASGGVFGIIGAVFFFTDPRARLMLYMIIPIPIRLGILLLVAAQIFFLFTGGGGNVAFAAHLGGALLGGIVGPLMYNSQGASAIWRAGFNWRNWW